MQGMRYHNFNSGVNMRYVLISVSLIFIAAFLLVGCPDPQDDTIVFWTTEEQPERIAVQEQIAERFFEETGVTVEIVPVSENQMSERATAAFAAGDLPDVIYAPLNLTVKWIEEGLLDPDAADEVVEDLGVNTFAEGAVSLVEKGGVISAVPVDGWTQLLVYRKDLFDANGLAAPRDYASILAAAEALHDPSNIWGFVAATDSSQVYMMQVFEHIALANGIDIVDSNGNVTLDTPAMIETLEFYKRLAELSPPGNLFWEQSRELYLAGKAAMIVWSPFIMDELAGLRDSAPVTFTDDPTSSDLAARTDFLTRIAGPSNPGGAGWTDVRYFNITVDADTSAAQDFVEFSMNEGYLQTLAIAPEGKFPVRYGDQDDPQRFVNGWSNLEIGVDRKARLADLYSSDVINNVVEGLETGSRWGFPTNNGDLTAKLYDTRIVAELVRQNIDGALSAEDTASAMQAATESLR